MIPGVPPFAQATFDLDQAFNPWRALAAGMMGAITTSARAWFRLRPRRRRGTR